MSKRKTIVVVSVVLTMVLLLAGQSLSQQQQQRQRGQAGDDRGPQGRQFDPQRMRQMMQQRMQQQLGVSDAEWKTLASDVMNVWELNQQLSGMGRGRMFARGGRAGRPGATDDTQQTELEKASEQLTTLLENKSATDEQIQKQLTALRAAKEKAQKQLAAVQEELKKKVSVRRQAQLVLMGLLD